MSGEVKEDFSTQPELKMISILSVPYENKQGSMSRLLYGVSTDGAVYKFQFGLNGWVKLPMVEVADTYDTKQKRDKRHEYDPSF